MEIRFAKPADIPGILNLLLQVGEVHHQGRPDLFRDGAQKYDSDALMRLLRDENRPIFVAVEDDKVLGYGFCIRRVYQDDPVMENFKTLYIDDLCVDGACRGKHIGRAIYEHICAYAKKIGCHNVTLNVWTCNERAMKFYESCGLKPQKIGMETILEEH